MNGFVVILAGNRVLLLPIIALQETSIYAVILVM
jgi:hypothetical protein